MGIVTLIIWNLYHAICYFNLGGKNINTHARMHAQTHRITHTDRDIDTSTDTDTHTHTHTHTNTHMNTREHTHTPTSRIKQLQETRHAQACGQNTPG